MGLAGREVSGMCSPPSVEGVGGSTRMGIPRGAGVDPDSEVRVRFPTVIMEVVGLRGRDGSGYRAY
jgi:hypothetical protein